MNRWKAAGVHLCISLLVIGTLIGSIYALWFPYGLFRIAGMDRLLLTMLLVDIVAGPMLTCFVYKTGKPSLKFDLTIIAVLQAAFLGYALHTLWVSRPVFLVWYIDRMSLVFANEIEPGDLAAGTSPEMRSLSWFGPRQATIILPKNPNERENIFIEMIRSGTGLDRLPIHYSPYSHGRSAILRQAKPINPGLLTNASPNASILKSAIESTGLKLDSLRTVPVESSRGAAVLLINADTALPLKVVPREPFLISGMQ